MRTVPLAVPVIALVPEAFIYYLVLNTVPGIE